MVSISQEGTLTLDGTEQDLLNKTGTKFYGGSVDLTALGAGDSVTIKEYRKFASAGSWILIHSSTYAGVQADKSIEFPTKPSAYGYRVTIQRTGGTVTDIPRLFFEGG